MHVNDPTWLGTPGHILDDEGGPACEDCGIGPQEHTLEGRHVCTVCRNSLRCVRCRHAQHLEGDELCAACRAKDDAEEGEAEVMFHLAATGAREQFVGITSQPTNAHREAAAIIADASTEAAKAGKAEVAELLLRAANRMRNAA
jgi:hypothetical protein